MNATIYSAQTTLSEWVKRANTITIHGLAAAKPYIVIRTKAMIFGCWDSSFAQKSFPYDRLDEMKTYAKKYGKDITIHHEDRKRIAQELGEQLPEKINL